MSKLSLALAVGIAYPLLDLAGFEAGSASGDGHAMLLALYGLAPVLMKLSVAGVIWRYPIDAAAHAGLTSRIAALAAAERT